MRTFLFPVILSGFLLSSCLPAILESPTESGPTLSEADLVGTAEVLSRQTLQALPTASLAPSNTPVVMTATLSDQTPVEMATSTSETTSETPTASNLTSIPTGNISLGESTTTTTLPGIIPTATETLHPRFYGTLPPNLPSGEITLLNKSKSEAYISLQCTTPDGYVTIIEYPVPFKVVTQIPSGRCRFVGWVGGVKMTGGFGLAARDGKVMTIFKDRIEVK